MSIGIVPIATTHVESFRECLDAVAREKLYLAQVEAPSLEHMRKFVQEGLATDVSQFVALDGSVVVGWCDIFSAWRHRSQAAGSLHCQGAGQRHLSHRARSAADNARAIGLYGRVGFVEEGFSRKSLRFDGIDHDAIRMALLAGPA